ncbi:hypothetical protein ACG7TL_006897 [Trametes sanguinea]
MHPRTAQAAVGRPASPSPRPKCSVNLGSGQPPLWTQTGTLLPLRARAHGHRHQWSAPRTQRAQSANPSQTLTSVPRYRSPGPPVPFAKGPEGRRDAFPRRREPAAVPRKNCVGPVTPPVPTARVDEGLRGGDVPIA